MDYLVLVDKFHPVTNELKTECQLVNIRGRLLEKECAKHMNEMLNEAENKNLYIKIISAYRSPDYQQMLWERSISEKIGKGMSYEAAVSSVSSELALSGASEHETGLAADLGGAGSDELTLDFAHTSEGKWLYENAHKFGFILRYPRMKEHLTGISFEPWHYRYVGVAPAKAMYESGICLEEYLCFYSGKYIDTKQDL